MAEKTKKPTGLKATRSGTKIILEWTKGDDNYDAALDILVKHAFARNLDTPVWNDRGYWSDQSVIKPSDRSITSYSFDSAINLNNYYPNDGHDTGYYASDDPNGFYLCYIDFGVAGTATGKWWSDYAWADFNVMVPSEPVTSVTWDSEYVNRSAFTWENTDSDDSHRVFTDYEVQTILVKDCEITDGSKLDWSGAETLSAFEPTVTTKTVAESNIFYDDYSYTRWVRARCRGPSGPSDWKYEKHVYAFPTTPVEVSAEVNNKTDLGKYRVSVKWKADSTETHPIDSTVISYAQVIPRVKSEIKYDDNSQPYRHVELLSPEFSNGTEIATTKDTSGYDGLVFTTESSIETDKAFALKVTTKHDNQTANSDPIYIPDGFGKLANPSNLVISSFDRTTHRIIINATNNSTVPHSHMAIMFQPHSETEREVCVGIIHEDTHLPITLTLPDISSETTFSIGVKARLGDFSPAYEPGNYAYTECELTNTIMESDTVWDAGSVYIYTKTPTLSSPKVGTIKVEWEWSWENASGAELSWSQDKDAWASTNEPSRYQVYGTNNSEWNISNLNVGTWYVRVRLFKDADGNTVYGGYSAIGEIKLSSAPMIPSLTLSESVIPEDGEVTCYWAYTTTDGTDQMQAEICIATVTNGVTSYGSIIGRTTTAQHITINATEQGWRSGDTVNLAVRVVSSSGEESEGWSPLATLSIANKQEIEIKDTTLVSITESSRTYNALTTMPLDVVVGLKELYSLSTDTVVVDDKTYYVKNGSTYSEAPTYIPSPAGYYEKTETTITINPHNLGYYEYSSGTYILTADTSWNDSKTYYVRSGSGTTASPYRYVVADKPSTTLISYDLTSDTTWNESTTYYYKYTLDGVDEYKAVSEPVENPRALSYYEQKPLDGSITLLIERAEKYHLDRPDESEVDGFEGETITIANQNGNGSFRLESGDLIGMLDDNCRYKIIATATDTYGQTTYADPVDFLVKWDHQAVVPSASFDIDDNDYIIIETEAPTGYEITPDTSVISQKSYYTRSGSGTEESPYTYTVVSNPSGNPHSLGYYQTYDYSADSCDIYRLSVDKPTLLVKDAAFGTAYVDMYPTLGEFGGYRVVYKTANGDYTTADKRLAWTDYGITINRFATIIDFGNDQVVLPYNVSVSNKWAKDFTETKYLGGSVQGDWNPAVSRTGSVSTTVVVEQDPDTIMALRRLASYPGICHIRTPEGSNFLANVSVNEDREEKWVNRLAKISLDITRVDSEVLDGVEYDQLFEE